MSTSLQNSIWPNPDGNLGKKKVKIPDGVNTFWPDGDALIGNFVYNDGELVGFVDTKSLIVNDSKSTIIDYDYVDFTLHFSDGEMTISRGARSKYFKVSYNPIPEVNFKYKGCKTVTDVKAVDPNYLTNDIVDGIWSEQLDDLEQGGNGSYGGGLFHACSNLVTFSSELPSLTDGCYMFCGCSNLASFSSDLSSLDNAESMFDGCSKLISFSSDLSNLTIGDGMFYGCPINSFNTDLSALTSGYCMFYGCTNLTTFNSNMSNLENGYYMFRNCSSLTSFTSNLSNVTRGNYMFHGCKLDTASVQIIADTINPNPPANSKIYIGIGNTTPNIQEEESFNTIVSKGWVVYVNGSNSSNIWSPTALVPIDGEEDMTPIPYYAKPI